MNGEAWTTASDRADPGQARPADAQPGRVYFVGAGPGAPDLITVRGQAILQRADVVVWTDSLVQDRLMAFANPDAKLYGSAGMDLDALMEVMIGHARAGRTVARVHTGDPSVFGAILEQMARLKAAGIPYEVVPGVSSVFAAAAVLGAELTVPELTQTVILTRVEGRTPMPERERLRDLAAHRCTIALFLSATLARRAVDELLAAGWAPETPVAVVQRATWPDQKVIRTTLAHLVRDMGAEHISSHAIILAGWALDPALTDRPGEHRSKLYDPAFTHRYRRGTDSTSAARPASRAADAGVAAAADLLAVADARVSDAGVADARVSDAGVAGVAGAADAIAEAAEAAEARAPRPYAVVAITKHGVDIARRLQAGLPGVDVYHPEKFARGDERTLGIHTFAGSVVDEVPRLWGRYQGIVGIVSLGAMVRMVAPLLRDKRTDPGVVVVDDSAQHVISVLSGHLGGANDLAREVARVLGATPVITTASDVRGTIAVDLLGRAFGWEIENFEQVTSVSAAVVNEERILVVQEAGEPGWWPEDRPLPPHIRVVGSVDAARGMSFDAALVVTPRRLREEEAAWLLRRGVLYRPKVLVVGVGCNRGTAAEEIESVIRRVLDAHGLSLRSVRNLATLDRKADEPGLVEVCQRYGWPLVAYRAEELNTIPLPHPSETVFKYVGAWGVSEPAARLSSGADGWLVEKVKDGNVTVSVCLVPHAPPPQTAVGGGAERRECP